MKFVMFEGRLRPWSEVARLRREARIKVESLLPRPTVIRDALDNVKNPVDGKIYDSKSSYYKAVKDAGCVIVGNEAEKLARQQSPRPEVTTREIGEAIQKVKQGYKPEIEYE
jgi:hypothetical protein